jgi:AraC-like DNA-binding protein
MPMTVTTFSDIHTTGVEEAEACLPQFMHLDHHPAAGFAFHQHTVACGPFSVEETRCTDGVHLDLLDQFEYAVGVPIRGPLHTEHRGQELDLGPGRAAIFAPSEEAAVDAPDDFDVVLVHIRSGALEDALEALLGRPVRRPLPLPATVPLDSAAGRALAATIGLAVHAQPDTRSVLDRPIGAEPLQYRLMVQLLLAADHPERDALDGPVPTWGPRTVRRCVDLIEEHPEWPLTLADLAAGAGLSVRALEGCWLRHRDQPPGHDIGRVRLDRAHRDLESHRPGETTVDAVATYWGFGTRPFVTAYTARYGRTPDATLRGPAFA